MDSCHYHGKAAFKRGLRFHDRQKKLFDLFKDLEAGQLMPG